MTPRPDLGSVAEELYGRLEPFHRRSLDGREVGDDELGWPLLTFFGLLAKRWQEPEDLIRDSDDGVGFSALFDPARVKDEALAWQGQAVGVTMLPGMTPAEQRARTEGTDGFKRGTPLALAVAAQRHLTGNKTVIINERLAGNAKLIGVVTYLNETPDPAQTQRDIEEQLPWELKLQYVTQDAWDYSTLRTVFDDYDAIRTHYNATGYQGIKDNDPPA